MKKPYNFKFLNKSPMILGFEFFDCAQAGSVSLVLFGITGSHLSALVIGFLYVVVKSLYKRLYPKNSYYFWRNKFSGIEVNQLLNSKDLK